MNCRIGIPLLAFLGLWCFGQLALAQQNQFRRLDRINATIEGRVLDLTRNHGSHQRFQSDLLQGPRDLYVYLPPNYDPSRQYALLVYVHGAFGDEHGILDTGQIPCLDLLIQRGCCPPLIAVFPDMTCRGRNFVTAKHSFLVNGCCGPFEDHIMHELLPWVFRCFSVDPDRSQHAIGGISAGGMAAMRMALRHRDFFGHAYSIAGPLNLRYQTRSGDYFADFDPSTYCPRSSWDPKAVVAQFGPLKLRAKRFIEPVFGSGPGVIQRIIDENPADLLFSTDLQPDELRMFVAYGLQDGFNFDAHGASFVYLAHCQGVAVDLDVDPQGTHSADYFRVVHRRALAWLGQGLPQAYHQPMPFSGSHAFLGEVEATP